MKRKLFLLVLFFIFYNHLGAMLRYSVYQNNNIEVVRLVDHLINEEDRFANLNMQETVLFSAVMNGWNNVVRMILKFNRALVNATDNFKNTPLHYAALLGDYINTEILVNYGAPIKAKNYYNKTPIDLAGMSLDYNMKTDRDVKPFIQVLENLILGVKVQ